MAIAELIQGSRQSAGLTQRGLAALAGVPQPSISELESGRQGDVTVGLLQRLLGACGAQLVAIPTKTPSVAAVGSALRQYVARDQTGLVLRQLLQTNDDLSGESPGTRLALCLTAPALTGDQRVDAFLAALVEHRLGEDGLPIPEWTSRPERYIDPAWDVAGVPALAEDVHRSTPEAFRQHGVLISDADLTSV